MKALLKELTKSQRVLSKTVSDTKKDIRTVEAKQREIMRALSEAKDSPFDMDKTKYSVSVILYNN